MAYHKYVGHKARQIRGGVRVIAVPQDEHSTTTAFGVDFPRGYWVNTGAMAKEHQDILSGNPGFVHADKPEKGEPVVEKPTVGPLHVMSDPNDDSHLYTVVEDEPVKGATLHEGDDDEDGPHKDAVHPSPPHKGTK